MNLLEQLSKELAPYWEQDIEIKRNDYITTPGAINTNMYFVVSGSLRVFIEDQTEEHTIRFGYKNSFITALDSFLKDIPTTFYIQALKKCTLKVISKTNFHKCVNASKENQELWTQLLQELVHQQIERENDLIIYSPQKRFERVFKRSPLLFQEIPQKYIASYLRMTPETLSRILRSLD